MRIAFGLALMTLTVVYGLPAEAQPADVLESYRMYKATYGDTYGNDPNGDDNAGGGFGCRGPVEIVSAPGGTPETGGVVLASGAAMLVLLGTRRRR